MQILASLFLTIMVISFSESLPVLMHYSYIQSPTFYAPQPIASQPVPGILYNEMADKPLAHPAVVQNSAAESQYAPELLNNFYKNPTIAAKLAKESWFTNKEFPVHHREAERIPRQKIYDIIDRIVNH